MDPFSRPSLLALGSAGAVTSVPPRHSGRSGASCPTWRSRLKLGRRSDRRIIDMFACITSGPSAHTRALLLLSGVVACTGSPATLAVPPSFEVMTPAGVASVSIHKSPPGMTDAEFAQVVMVGMERAARGSVIAGRVEPPFPSRRIVWHVDLSASRGTSELVVNAFDSANPYAYEQETVTNDAPSAVITSAVESMSERLLADVAAHVNMPNQLGRQVP